MTRRRSRKTGSAAALFCAAIIGLAWGLPEGYYQCKVSPPKYWVHKHWGNNA